MRRINGPIDCSLCKRLRPPVSITVGEKEPDEILDRKRPKLERSNGEELLLPEQKYPPECIPCYEFFCKHYYHVPCLARLNPKKYTDITYRTDGIRDTLELDEFNCLDCHGTQPINCRFDPNKEGHVNEVEANGTIYINVPEAFEQAEQDMNTFLHRYDELEELELDFNQFVQDSRKEAEEYILPALKLPVIQYLSLMKNDMVFQPVVSSSKFDYVNRVTHEPAVSLKDLMDGIDVHWSEEDKNYFKKRQLYVNDLNLYGFNDHENIRHLNRLAVPIKRYLQGEEEARKLIQEDDITKLMLYGTNGHTKEIVCVKSHTGEVKQSVTFDDFPIREATSCSIMGGKRKTKLIRKRRKTVKNVFRGTTTRV